MKSYKIILIITAALALGFLAGYLRFTGHQQRDVLEMDHSDHATDETIWTCSMHPQIRQDEPGKCPICGMDLVPLGQFSGGDGRTFQMTPEAAKLAQIETIAVGLSTGTGSKRHVLTGKIQADERRASSQVAHIGGRIEQLYVTFTGESIAAGQKLATLYAPELVTAQRELLEAVKLKESRPQLLDAARKKLSYWKIPQNIIDEIESSGQVRPNITVVAEHAGVVMERHVSVGDYVREGEPLFDIVNLNSLWVLLDAYEENLSTIRVGDQVTFSVVSIPGRQFSAKVSFIDPVINARTRVASVRAEVSNTQGLLKPEMLIRAEIESRSGTKSTHITVPKSAVLWTGTRSVVYVQDPNATVPSYEFREVAIGETGGDHYTVLEGLSEGERIVVNGTFVIDAAAQLNNMSSMMNRNVSISRMERSGPDFRSETPEAFREKLQGLLSAYLGLKDALINSDQVHASKIAVAVGEQLQQVPISLLSGDAHQYWMEQSSAIETHTANVAAATDIEKQRKEFSHLTSVVIESLRALGSTGDTLFVQYCPMAFDNTGAEWLSNESMIRNPYFGDKMLKCGSVTETIPSRMPDMPKTQNQIHQH